MSFRSLYTSFGFFLGYMLIIRIIENEPFKPDSLLSGVIFLSMWVAPGYVAARLAVNDGILHAASAGLICSLLGTPVLHYVFFFQETPSLANLMQFTAIVWFTLGGVVWRLHRRHLRHGT